VYSVAPDLYADISAPTRGVIGIKESEASTERQILQHARGIPEEHGCKICYRCYGALRISRKFLRPKPILLQTHFQTSLLDTFRIHSSAKTQTT
jgi:hypothetical protein